MKAKVGKGYKIGENRKTRRNAMNNERRRSKCAATSTVANVTATIDLPLDSKRIRDDGHVGARHCAARSGDDGLGEISCKEIVGVESEVNQRRGCLYVRSHAAKRSLNISVHRASVLALELRI